MNDYIYSIFCGACLKILSTGIFDIFDDLLLYNFHSMNIDVAVQWT